MGAWKWEVVAVMEAVEVVVEGRSGGRWKWKVGVGLDDSFISGKVPQLLPASLFNGPHGGNEGGNYGGNEMSFFRRREYIILILVVRVVCNYASSARLIHSFI